MGCNEAQKLADPNCPCALRVHVDFRANLSAAEWLNTGRICLSPCEGKLPLLDVISKANCQLDAKKAQLATHAELDIAWRHLSFCAYLKGVSVDL